MWLVAGIKKAQSSFFSKKTAIPDVQKLNSASKNDGSLKQIHQGILSSGYLEEAFFLAACIFSFKSRYSCSLPALRVSESNLYAAEGLFSASNFLIREYTTRLCFLLNTFSKA
jgi:hypothetical protein